MTTTAMKPFEDEIAGLIDFAKTHAITNVETHAQALEFIDKTYELKRKAEKVFRPDIQNAHRTWKGLTSKLKSITDAADRAKAIINPKVVAWQEAREKEARERERQQQEELRKQEEEHILDRAITHEEMGCPNIATEILDEPVVVPRPEVIPETAKREGLITKSRWTAEVADDRALLALVKHIAEHPEHVELVKPNPSALNRLAGALKQNLKIPGVTVKEEKKVQRAGKFTT